MEGTAPSLNCGVFSNEKPVDLTHMSLFDKKKMLSWFVACIEANSFLDIDGFYFIYQENWYYESKYTGLMAAIALGFNDFARTLIHYDANFNLRDKWGSTSLVRAALVGNTNMVGILLDLGAPVNGVDKRGYMALHAAASAGHVDTVRLLLERGADINARGTVLYGHRAGITQNALEMASFHKQKDVVALLQSWGR